MFFLVERTPVFIEANEQPQWILIAPASWMWTVPHHHSSLCVLKSVAHWAVLRLGSHLENEFGVLKAVDNSPEFIQEDILLDIRVIE